MTDKTNKLKELFGSLFAKLMEFSIEQEFLNSLGEHWKYSMI